MEKVAPCGECRRAEAGFCDCAARYDCRGFKEDGSPAIVAVGECTMGFGRIEVSLNEQRVRWLQRDRVLPF